MVDWANLIGHVVDTAVFEGCWWLLYTLYTVRILVELLNSPNPNPKPIKLAQPSNHCLALVHSSRTHQYFRGYIVGLGAVSACTGSSNLLAVVIFWQ